MIRFYLLIVLIVIGYTFWRKLSASPVNWRALYSKTNPLIIGGLLLVALGITGHLAWLTALIGVLMAFFMRALPLLLRYAPDLHRFWQSAKASKQQRSSGGFETPRQGKMTATEAYKILGLTPPAAKQEIILAHKKLMQKMHPDRGGSDYLASQINLAKDLLLKN